MDSTPHEAAANQEEPDLRAYRGLAKSAKEYLDSGRSDQARAALTLALRRLAPHRVGWKDLVLVSLSCMEGWTDNEVSNLLSEPGIVTSLSYSLPNLLVSREGDEMAKEGCHGILVRELEYAPVFDDLMVDRWVGFFYRHQKEFEAVRPQAVGAFLLKHAGQRVTAIYR